MKLINNNKGIALVTSLMLTLITLGITMIMLTMVLQNTQMSGAHKRYKNSLDAAVGGVEIMTKDAIPYLISAASLFATTASPAATFFKDNLTASMPGLDASTLIVADNNCLNAKLTQKDWGASCTNASKTTNPKDSPDLSFVLRSQITGAGTSTGFRVYTKIVSTTPGSTDLSGRNLEGLATTGQPPQDVGAPYLYRIEVTGERVTNPSEKANLSVLYAY